MEPRKSQAQRALEWFDQALVELDKMDALEDERDGLALPKYDDLEATEEP